MARRLGGTLRRTSVLASRLPVRDPLGHRQPAVARSRLITVARNRGTVAADGRSGWLRRRTGKRDADESEKRDERNTENETRHDHRPFDWR